MRILLVRLSSFGDILFVTPAIAALAERYPDAQIDVVVYERFKAALEHHPQVTRLLTLPKKNAGRAMRSWKLGESAGHIVRFVRQLRSERYDLVVDMHNVTDSALIANLARAKHRVGNCRQTLSRFFRTRCGFDDRNETANEHAAASNLRYLVEAGSLSPQVLEQPPRLQFYAPSTAHDAVSRFLQVNNLTGRELIGLNPGGSYEYKRWPAERFAAVGEHLRKRNGAALLLFGGPAEREVVAQVTRGIGGQVIDTSELPLYEAFELIGRLRLLVTNDSAPLHIAAAAGIPAVGLYGPANFKKFYPLSSAIHPVLVDVACRPCTPSHGKACSHRECFSKINIKQVCEACDKALSSGRQRQAS